MNLKKWPLFEDWEEIFGKDRATGEFAEGLQDAVEEIERSQAQGISNKMNLGFPIDVVDDEDKADAGHRPNVATGEAEYAHIGPSTFFAASQSAYGGTQQAENTREGPSAFTGASQGAYGGNKRGQNQDTDIQTSSSKANEKEKCRKRKKPIEDGDILLNGLIEVIKQFTENHDKRMGALVDKLGDRDHSETCEKVLTILASPAFELFNPEQKIKAAMWFNENVKRMQIFLSRGELQRQTMMWMIINGEI